SIHHRPGEIKCPLVQVAPDGPYPCILDISRFFGRNRGGATCKPTAVRGIQRCFKERLRSDRRKVPVAASTGQTCIPAAELHDHLAISFGERLAAERHHVGHGVDVNRLKFVANLPPDVAEFNHYLTANLTLQSEVELMAHAWTEVGIQT